MHESTYGRVHHTVSLAVKYESSQITQQTSCSANRALSNTTVGISIATTTAATTIPEVLHPYARRMTRSGHGN